MRKAIFPVLAGGLACLVLDPSAGSPGSGFGGQALAAEPPQAASSSNVLFEGIARQAPRGSYPKYFSGEQSYFTVIGGDGGEHEGLLNEEGALEVDKGAFSIEPFLYSQGKLATWNEAAPVQELERDYLPVPSVAWHWNAITLKATAYAMGQGEDVLYARYRIDNTGTAREAVKLFLAIRPFQVNPPWQSLNMVGGVAEIRSIQRDGRLIRVNGDRAVVPLTFPDRFGALGFERRTLIDILRQGRVPRATQARDAKGLASGVLEYDLDLPPGSFREVYLAVPYRDIRPWLARLDVGDGSAFGRDRFQETLAYWDSRLNRAELVVPPAARKFYDAARSNLAYLLIHRDGPALYPGSRTYARSWIRDGAVMSSALLGMGYPEEARDFIRWYAGFQFPDGKIPCCVDARGADPVPENDSHGEFIHAVAEYYRYTHDLGFVRDLWPAVVKTAGYIEALRRQRMTEAYRTPEKRLFFGLVPDSISHEGYAAHPVHSFWDGFWTLRGLKDAAELAGLVKDEGNAIRFAAFRDGFRKDLYAALDGTMARYGIGYLPGSVELGDFDATATAMIVNTGGEQENLPREALKKSFDDYWDFVRRRRDHRVDWDAYTPYEVRNVEALVRLGRREQAWELLEYLMAGQRPPAWNHWAEMVWHDAKAPKFLGDMPHAWIGAEFVRALRTFLAYERENDRALVLAAGIPAAWLDGGSEVGVRRLPTWFGTLSYRLRRTGPDELRLELSGDLTMPPGKIVIKPPSDRPIRALTVNGRPSVVSASGEGVVGEFPGEVVLKYGAARNR